LAGGQPSVQFAGLRYGGNCAPVLSVLASAQPQTHNALMCKRYIVDVLELAVYVGDMLHCPLDLMNTIMVFGQVSGVCFWLKRV
jgi:hypothetical protein